MKISKIVELAQSGDEDAKLQLLKIFGWSEGKFTKLLGKYVDMLWYGKLNLKNKDSRKFIRLYISDPEVKYKLKFHNMDYVSTMKAQQMMDFVQYKVREHYTKKELKQEITLVFLERLDKYKKVKRIQFSGYLMGTFRFAVYQAIQKRVFKYDFLNASNKEYVEIPYIDTLIENIEKDYLSEKEELDIFWINGETGKLFKELDKLDRIILRDWYVYRKTDTEIAKNNGYHRNSILNKRHKIIKHLEEKIKKELGN